MAEDHPKLSRQLSRIKQLKQQLNCLQAELAKMQLRGLNHRELGQRKAALGSFHTRINQLEVLLNLNSTSQITQIGLPNLRGAKVGIGNICNRYLDSRLYNTKKVFLEIKQISRWASDAAKHIGGGFKGTLRLAKYKKIRIDLENLQTSQEMEKNRQDKLVKAVSNNLADNGIIAKQNQIETLLGIYDHLNTLASRVERLENRLKTENSKVMQMKEWLAEQSHTKIPNPPSIEQMQHMKKLSEASCYQPIKYSEKRLTLARNFVNNCLEVGSPSPKRSHSKKIAYQNSNSISNKPRKEGDDIW